MKSFEPSRVAEMPVPAPLIAAWTAVALSPALIVIDVPLRTSVPPAEFKAASDCEPVSTAAASRNNVAPLPMILATAGAPATGLAEKFD
jgi:hypothetical protein